MRIIIIAGAFLMVAALCIAGCSEPSGGEGKTVVVGAKTFNEQYILAEMAGLLLEDAGYQTEMKANLNDLSLYEGIRKDQVDVYIEYTGTAYSQLLKLPTMDTWEPDLVYDKVAKGLGAENITVLSRLGFRDDYTIAVPEAWAEEKGITRVSELAPYAGDMILVTDYVFAEREDGLPQVAKIYNFTFKEAKPMSPALMYEVIKSNEADAITPYTTDTRVDLYDLRILEDDRAAFPPYHAILLANDRIAGDEKAVGALSVLSERIDADTMRRLNYEFDIDKREAREIARDYLVAEGLIKA